MGKGSQRKSCALESNTIFRIGNCMCISTAIKIATDHGTLMINGLFLRAENTSYRIWPSWETLMKYSLVEHILKTPGGVRLGFVFLYVVDQLCHVVWIISSCFCVIYRSNSNPSWTRAQRWCCSQPTLLVRALLHAEPGAAVGWLATSPGLTSARLPPQLNQR